MIPFALFLAILIYFVYGFDNIIKKDHKRQLLQQLQTNHIKMEERYAELEELIFLKDYADYSTRNATLSYDLYLAGMKKQNALFEKEMQELQAEKFNTKVEQFYTQLLHIHNRQLRVLQSEIDRVKHSWLLRQPAENQWSA